MKINALVLGNDSRSTLAVVRSLGRSGAIVDLGASLRTAPSRYSRYTNKTYLLPDPMNNIKSWLVALKTLLRKNNYDIVIPATEISILPIMREYEELCKLSLFAIPEPEIFLRTLRKDQTLDLARGCEVPIPKSYLVSSVEDIEEAASNLIFPIVMKPASSKIGIHDEQISLRVRYAKDANELSNHMRELLKFTPVLLQEKVQGVGVGQEFLARDGNILAMFQHERIREPPGGGGSSYRKSVRIDHEILAYSKRLISKLKWTGVLMVEYKSDSTTGQNWLMEINGRFWGSLPLAIAAGVDFPKLMIEMYLQRKEIDSPKYLIGTKCRNMLLDLGWVGRRLFGSEKGAGILDSIRNLLQIPVRLLARTDCSDTFNSDDIAPGFMEFYSFFEFEIMKKLFALLLAYRKKRYLKTSNIMERRVEAAKRIRDAGQVLFFCKGNICRSPFAEEAFKSILSKSGLEGVSVESAGKIAREGRRSPAAAVASASEIGIDLTNHVSRRLTQTMLDDCGVIFVMDASEYQWIKKTFRNATDKMFFLGEFNDSEVVEIEDPWGKSLQTFHSVYNHIEKMLHNLGDYLNEVAPIC